MARRSLASEELLLLMLRLLDQRPMQAGELLGELERLLGPRRGPSAGAALIALSSLEAERLVEVAAPDGSDVYRTTPEGSDAVARRADVSLAPRGPGSRSGRAPRHRLEQVAVLFTDVVGSTELLDRLGDDAAHQLRRRHFELLRAAVRDHGGREVKSLGDGLMVAFDSPEIAGDAALAMQRAVGDGDDALGLRVGIAVGETVREDDDYFGRPVVVARRLCDAAGAGEVLVSGAVRDFPSGPSGVDCDQLGPVVLKGLSEPVAPMRLRLRELPAEG
jgi:class 3 adenylate cyclase